MAKKTDDVVIKVDDIIKFNFQSSALALDESLTVRVKLIHDCNGKIYYYLDMSGLIVPTEENNEYYLTGDRFYLSHELEAWKFNVTKVYCEDNASVACPFIIEISNLKVISKD